MSYQASPDSSTTNTDPHWSGIVVTNGGFNYAFSDWTVPCYSGGNYWYRQLQWVGLGNTNLWQAGTETDEWEGYRFWYENLPGSGDQIYAGPAVGCGDHVAVQVDYNYTVANKSYLYMSNYSRSTYWSTSKAFQPGSNQAEWIVERTQCGGGNGFALQQTGQTNWTYVQAESTSVNGDRLEPAGAFNYQDVSMWYSGTELAHTGGLLSDQKSFDNYFDHSGSSQC